MKFLYSFIMVMLLTTLTFATGEKSMQLPVIPQPQKVFAGKDYFPVPETFTVSFEENANLEKSYNKLNLLKNTKKVTLNKSNNSENANLTFALSSNYLKEIPACKYKNESYHLNISKSGITINATTPKGVFYGVVTLIQMVENLDKLPVCDIYDYPDLGVRGISDDISRGQVSKIENFKRIIDFLGRYKMNTFMPYMEDVLEISAYPQIGKNRGALTKEEVAKIHKYAEANFIEVVPIYQTLGHYENILLIEDFLQYAEFPGAASLNVSNPDTYVFLENMLKEVFEMFPSEYFHMGADESWDVGLGESKHLVEKSNIADVHAEHYRKVNEICKKYGKKVIMYGDVILHHPEILEKLPKDITVVDWHYGPKENNLSPKTFHEAGQRFYVSPSVWNFLTTFPTNMNSVPNIKYLIEDGIEYGASGMINSNWGDYGAETFKEQILYGYAWSAQCAWNFTGSNIGTFNEDFFNDFFGVKNYEGNLIYQTLANDLNQEMWHAVWRHPLLPIRKPVWWEPGQYLSKVVKINSIDQASKTLDDLTSSLEKKATKNVEHLEFIKFQKEFMEWYALKLETQFQLHDALDTLEYDKDATLEMIDKNIEMLSKLKLEFARLWKKYYKPENLYMVEDKFDRLIAYFGETRKELVEDKLESPIIKSKWIYFPTEEDNYVKHAVFKKEFEIEGDIKDAKLQLIGDTYAKLYINGKLVDKVFARRSLSLLVDYARIKMLDVKEYLKPGKNEIEVFVDNYNRKGNAGVNIQAEISADKNYTINSDSSWLSNIIGMSRQWQSAQEEESTTIIKPNFSTGRTSWIER